MNNRNRSLHLTTGAWRLLVFPFALWAGTVGAQPIANQIVAAASARTITPGKLTGISVDSLPNSACTLEARDDSGSVHSLTIYSDDQGRVQFHVMASAETTAPVPLELQCAANNQTMEHRVLVSASSSLSVSESAVTKPPSASARIRPVLTGDPMLPSQQELILRGYPYRPDQTRTPEAYATWLRMATTETTIVEPRTVTRPDRSHAAASNPPPQPVQPSWAASPVWSGIALYQNARVLGLLKPYDMISGEWYVPAVTGQEGIKDYTAFWVGMDGWNNRDVLQDGTEQDVFTISAGFVNFTVASYYAWGEFFPFNEQVIPNIPVSPGDHLFGQIWMADSTGNPNVNGTVGMCFLENLTTKKSTTVTIAPPPGTVFSGATAEWIMERPLFNGAVTDLANYGYAQMFNAWAMRSDGTTVEGAGDANTFRITMENSAGAVLSDSKPVFADSMVFQWYAFK